MNKSFIPPELHWMSIDLHLEYQCQSNPHAKYRHGFGLFAIEALFMGIKQQIIVPQQLCVAFHGLNIDLHHRRTLHMGEQIWIRCHVRQKNDHTAGTFLPELVRHIHQQQHTFWKLINQPTATPQHCGGMQWLNSSSVATDSPQLALYFNSILRDKSFVRAIQRKDDPISAEDLYAAIARRMQRLFGDQLPEVLPYLGAQQCISYGLIPQQYTRYSHSKPDGIRPIFGLMGEVAFVEPSLALRFCLAILQDWHLDGDQAASFCGHYQLQTALPDYFDQQLLNPALLLDSIETTLRQNDLTPWLVDGVSVDEPELCIHLLQQLSDADSPLWHTPIYQAHRIRKADGGQRIIEQIPTLHLLLQRHVLLILNQQLDRLFSGVTVGYRPEKSVDSAIKHIQQWTEQGYRYAIRLDIADCFASIPIEPLWQQLQRLIPHNNPYTRRLLVLWLFASVQLQDSIYHRQDGSWCGLAQGSPLSALLANLYLMPLDRHIAQQNHWKGMRYGDDILVLTKQASEMQHCEDQLLNLIQQLGLKPNRDKTQQADLKQGIQYLGQTIAIQHFDPINSELILAQRKPLYIVTPHVFLGCNGDALQVRQHGTILDVIPLRRIFAILVFGQASFSSALLEKCSRQRIPIIFSLNSGYRMAQLGSDSAQTRQISRAHRTWFDTLGAATRLHYAKLLVQHKIQHHIQHILQRRGSTRSAEVTHLNDYVAQLKPTHNVETVLGLEGAAAKLYWRWLQTQIKPEYAPTFHSKKRSKPNAVDPLNAMLNFGYFLLYNRIHALLLSHHLDPYLSFLHEPDGAFEGLVADLLELFRVHVDRLVLRLINRQQVQARDFYEVQKNNQPHCRLHRDAIKTFIDEFERMLSESVGGVILRDALFVQVQSLRQSIDHFRSRERTVVYPLQFYQWQSGTPTASHLT